MHNHHDTRGYLPGMDSDVTEIPTGMTASNFAYSIQARLLPYTELTAMFEMIDFKLPLTKGSMPTSFMFNMRDIITVLPPLMNCPSDKTPALVPSPYMIYTDEFESASEACQTAPGNYVVCTGDNIFRISKTTEFNGEKKFETGGLFHYNSRYTFGEITDGTSNTTALSELIVSEGIDYSGMSLDEVKAAKKNIHLIGSNFTLKDTDSYVWADPQTLADKNTGSKNWSGQRGTSWIVGAPFSSTFGAFLPPNSSVPCANWMNHGLYGAYSYHNGGVNVLLADGSVHFVPNSIDYNVWKAGATIAGSEAVAGF